MILKRGLDYHRKGLVDDLNVKPTLVTAEVAGTDPYSVTIQTRDDVVTDAYCTCPYEAGPICKHVVAVLFALQQGIVPADVNAPPSPSKQPFKQPSKPKPRAILQFEPQTQKEVASLVKGVLRDVARGRPKFIAWDQTQYVATGMAPFLVQADQWMSAGNHVAAMNIAAAVMCEMVPAFEYTDDSNGDLGGCVYEAVELLKSIAKADLTDVERKALLDFCHSAYQKGTFKDWDWHLDLLRIAADAVKTPSEANAVQEKLGAEAKSIRQRDDAQFIRMSLIRKMDGDAAAEAYIASHLNNPNLREEAIRIAIHRGQTDRANELADGGIQLDAKGRSGHIDTWIEWKLKSAQASKNPEMTLRFARELFFRRPRNESDLYSLMKRTVPAEEWSNFVEGLIQDLQSERYVPIDRIASIYISESKFDRLLSLVQGISSLNSIQLYHPHLAGLYPAELASIYRNALFEYLNHEKSRNAYVNAVRILRRMKKLGQGALVEQTIEEFRKRYGNRPALMEELGRV